jgi:hypothetical protein
VLPLKEVPATSNQFRLLQTRLNRFAAISLFAQEALDRPALELELMHFNIIAQVTQDAENFGKAYSRVSVTLGRDIGFPIPRENIKIINNLHKRLRSLSEDYKSNFQNSPDHAGRIEVLDAATAAISAIKDAAPMIDEVFRTDYITQNYNQHSRV